MKPDSEVFGLGNRRMRQKRDTSGSGFNDYEVAPPETQTQGATNQQNTQVDPTGQLDVPRSNIGLGSGGPAPGFRPPTGGTDPSIGLGSGGPAPIYTTPLPPSTDGTDQSIPPTPMPMPTDLSPDALLNLLSAQQRRVGR